MIYKDSVLLWSPSITYFLTLHTVSVISLLILFAGWTAYVFRKSPTLATEEFDGFANSLPAIIWAERQGKLLWANTFHSEISATYGIKNLTLSKFSIQGSIKHARQVPSKLKNHTTKSIHDFEISTLMYRGRSYYVARQTALPPDPKKDANRVVKNITQAFANAPVGVAVFDKDRGLSMFNPALSNLLELSPTWLAQAPTMKEFLNRLHDKGALPEPRDFNAWRDDLIAMDFEKSGSHYHDDWNMPNGSVFTVSAYPQADKTITLYAEDITGRLLVEQEFRNHLDTLYSAFDAIEDPVALFDPSGELSFANTAFDSVWGEPFSQSIILPSVLSISKVWVDMCIPSPAFGDLREFIFQLGDREKWNSKIELKNGQRFDMIVTPLAHGQTLCEFRHLPFKAEFQKPKIRRVQKKPVKV